MEITQKIIDMLYSKDKEMNSLAEQILKSDYRFTGNIDGKVIHYTFPKYMDINIQLYTLRMDLKKYKKE